MEETVKKPRRIFTPQQKFEMLEEIKQQPTIRAGLAKYPIHSSMYRRWKRQVEVGVNATLRTGRPVKSPEVRGLEAENRTLKEALLNQSLWMAELKKEMRLDLPNEHDIDSWNPNGKRSSSLSRSSGRWGGR